MASVTPPTPHALLRKALKAHADAHGSMKETAEQVSERRQGVQDALERVIKEERSAYGQAGTGTDQAP